MARVVFLAGDPDWLGPALQDAATGRSYAFLSREASASALAAALSQAEALIARPGDALAVRPACPGLRFVQFTSCDYDQAVLAELQSKGLSVAGLGAALADEVAALAVGLMLAVHSGSRRVIKPEDEAWARLARDLSGRTVGIIGLGRVGADKVALEARQVLEASGGEIIQDDDAHPLGLERQGQVRADEAGPAGDEDPPHRRAAPRCCTRSWSGMPWLRLSRLTRSTRLFFKGSTPGIDIPPEPAATRCR